MDKILFTDIKKIGFLDIKDDTLFLGRQNGNQITFAYSSFYKSIVNGNIDFTKFNGHLVNKIVKKDYPDLVLCDGSIIPSTDSYTYMAQIYGARMPNLKHKAIVYDIDDNREYQTLPPSIGQHNHNFKTHWHLSTHFHQYNHQHTTFMNVYNSEFDYKLNTAGSGTNDYLIHFYRFDSNVDNMDYLDLTYNGNNVYTKRISAKADNITLSISDVLYKNDIELGMDYISSLEQKGIVLNRYTDNTDETRAFTVWMYPYARNVRPI